MGTHVGTFTNSTSTFEIRVTGDGISDGVFDIISTVQLQQGNQSRNVDDIFSPIAITQMRFQLRDEADLLDEIVASRVDTISVELVETSASNRVWFSGYVQKNNLEVNQYWTQDAFTLVCYDGLNFLDNKDYQLEGKKTLAEFISLCLQEAKNTTTALFFSDWQEKDMPSNSPALIRFQTDLIDASSYSDALATILARFNLKLSLISTVDKGLVWYIVKRDLVGTEFDGATLKAWEIDTTDGSVTEYSDASVEINKASTLTDEAIEAEHTAGTIPQVDKIESLFSWNTEPPFFENNSFQNWGEDDVSPRFWQVSGGTLAKTQQDDLSFMATSTNDNPLSTAVTQSSTYIKGAYQNFNINIELQNLASENNPEISPLREFNVGSVRFIDPNGEDPDLYLLNNGTVTETQSTLSYSVSPAKNQGPQDISLSYGLIRVAAANIENKIVEVTFVFSLLDSDGDKRWDSVSVKSIKGDVSARDIPNRLLTKYDSDFNYSVITREFPISTQADFNAQGQIEIFAGVFWKIGTVWGAEQIPFDSLYVSELNAQTSKSIKYYKLSLLPEAYQSSQVNLGFAYSGGTYSIGYSVIDFLSSTTTVQMYEILDEVPSEITRVYLLEEDDAILSTSSIDPIEILSLEIASIDGIVSESASQTSRGLQWEVSWSDIRLKLRNGRELNPPDGVRAGFTKNAPPAPAIGTLEIPRANVDVTNAIIITRYPDIAEDDWVQAGEAIYFFAGSRTVTRQVVSVEQVVNSSYRVTLSETINIATLRDYSPIEVNIVDDNPTWVGLNFYYDAPSNTIETVTPEQWQSDDRFLDPRDYVLLWETRQSGGPSTNSAPTLTSRKNPLFADNATAEQAELRDVIWDYKTNIIAKIANNLDGDYTTLQIDPEYPVRVNLPQGEHIIIQSDEQEYELTVADDVESGALEIPIQDAYIVAFSGAVVKYAESQVGSQLLIQPSSVLVIAESANENASLALSSSSANGTAIANLSATVLGPDGTGNTAGLLLDVTRIGARAVLEVDGGGNIATIELLTGDRNSEVRINADQIDVNGETTFFDGITRAINDGDIVVPEGVTTYYQETEPTGGTYVVGDLWFDTSEEGSGKPSRWDGNNWIRAYATFNGGLLTLGSVDADKINVENLFAQTIEVGGSLKATGSRSDNYVELSSAGLTGFFEGTRTFDIPVDGAPRFLAGEIENVEIKLYEASVIRTNSDVVANGGLIMDSDGLRVYDTSGNLTVNINNSGNATFEGRVVATEGRLGNLEVNGTLTLFNGSIQVPSGDAFQRFRVTAGVTEIGDIVFGPFSLDFDTTATRLSTNNLIVGTSNISGSNFEVNNSGDVPNIITNGIRINGVGTISNTTVTNPTSITVRNGLITAIS